MVSPDVKQTSNWAECPMLTTQESFQKLLVISHVFFFQGTILPRKLEKKTEGTWTEGK